MDVSQPINPNSVPRKRWAIVDWLLAEIPPRSVGGILAVALAMWVLVLADASFNPDWFPTLPAKLWITMAIAAGFLSLAGLGRVRRDIRRAKTKAGKGAIVLAIVPLLAMAALTILQFAVILVAMLNRL